MAFKLSGRGQNTLGIGDQVFASRGQDYTATMPLQQLQAELFLQLHDLPAERGLADATGLRCAAKVRYRQDDQACEVRQLDDGRLSVTFDVPQRAVAPITLGPKREPNPIFNGSLPVSRNNSR